MLPKKDRRPPCNLSECKTWLSLPKSALYWTAAQREMWLGSIELLEQLNGMRKFSEGLLEHTIAARASVGWGNA